MLLAEIFAPHDAAVVVTSIIGLIAVMYKIVPKREDHGTVSAVRKLDDKIDALEKLINDLRYELVEIRFKANQCWDYLFRSAARTVVAGGFGTSNSPLTINPEVMGWFAPMKTELREWYGCQNADPTVPMKTTERDLLINLDHVFGARILEQISLPHDRPYPACLIIAFAVARGERIVDLPCLSSSPENIEPPTV